MRLLAAASTAAVLAAAAAAATAAAAPTLHAVRTREPLRLDGRLDDTVWTEAAAFDAFRQSDPKEGAPASERTEVRVAYDDDALYIGLRLHDAEPRRIDRQLSRRDEPVEGDRVTVYLDPHHDRRTGVQFEVSAANVQTDAVIFNDTWTDSTWDAVWESAVAVDAAGWSVEMRVPFAQLRFSKADAHTFGINVSRNIPRKNETQWLELVPKKESGLASRMADLVGLDGLHPQRALSLLPYAVARYEVIAPEGPGDPWNDGSNAASGFGLDAKYGVSSNMTLDVTVNPDFGQVEVDPAVVNLSEFETFFEEKRPFFLEGAPIFGNFGRTGANSNWGFNRSEPNLFYSRRIGRAPQGETDGDFVDRPEASTILGAVKLSGKTRSGWSVAGLQAITERETARMITSGEASRTTVEPFTSYSAVRAQRDVGHVAFGLIGTAVIREKDDAALLDRLPSRAFVVGADGHVFLDKKKDWVIHGRLAGSRLEGSPEAMRRLQEAPARYFQRPGATHVRLDPARTSLSGYTGSLALNRNSGNILVNAALWGTSPGFDSDDLGFTGRADRWGGHVVGQWRTLTPDKWTRERFVWVAKAYSLNFAGARQSDAFFINTGGQLHNYWRYGLMVFKRWRAADDGLTRGGPPSIDPSLWGGGVFFESNRRKRLGVVGEVFYNHNEFGGSAFDAWANIFARPFASLSVSLGPNLHRGQTAAQYVDTVDDALATHTSGKRYVFGELGHDQLSVVGRVNWLLSSRMSLQLYFQPLLSAGDYAGFKELARPGSFDFLRHDGVVPPYALEDPDFNFKSLRINAIYRWEWRPGTTLYVAWTDARESDDGPATLRLRRDARELLRAEADDVFLVKVAYRFGR